ncbi:ATP-binding protein [Candidatus Pelagibacter sp.]|nr:ATP-binding protein [Candidatus Pelagibacter sp.]
MKKLLPKQLFYRGLLIVALPIIILQITISIVFFDSLWIKTNIGMTRALVGEIKTFIESYNLEGSDREFLESTFEDNLNIDVRYFQNDKFLDEMKEKWYSPIDRSLRRELKSKDLVYWFDTSKFKNKVNLKIQNKNDYFEFFIPRERLTSTSVRIFALWITLPAILIVAIAIIFLKNQTRPIKKLAEISKKFGRGEDIGEFVPSGASEIRQAGYEFEKMRKRILRHLNQRSEMLSGISHDLRTPLTRMKLQLALIKDKNLINRFSNDIDEMEKMLNEYLQFSSESNKEQTEKFELNELLKEIISNFDNSMIKFNIGEKIYFNGRKLLIQRCLNNLIENSIKFSNLIEINFQKLKSNILIIVEDNGPGIPISERENVFKPFYKIDKSRSENSSSVGLGLSISSDIIRSHGGKIDLSDSKMGGLKVIISLPF